MTDKRFTTNGYYINDTYHDGRKWLVNEVEAEEIVNVMNGLDMKVRESRKAMSKLQKENEQLRQFINKGRRLSVKELMDNANENELLKKKIRELESILADDIVRKSEIKDAWKQRIENR